MMSRLLRQVSEMTVSRQTALAALSNLSPRDVKRMAAPLRRR
jgi:hypothetical protein